MQQRIPAVDFFIELFLLCIANLQLISASSPFQVRQASCLCRLQWRQEFLILQTLNQHRYLVRGHCDLLRFSPWHIIQLLIHNFFSTSCGRYCIFFASTFSTLCQPHARSPSIAPIKMPKSFFFKNYNSLHKVYVLSGISIPTKRFFKTDINESAIMFYCTKSL